MLLSRRLSPLFALCLALIFSLTALAPQQARAQELIWLQIEAQPTEAQASERAAAYAAAFPNTRGFTLRSGWHAIVLGPYDVAAGLSTLNALKAENLIPRDSYVTDGAEFTAPFWPPSGRDIPEVTTAPLESEPPLGDAPQAETPQVEALQVEPPLAPSPETAFIEESLAEARASEAALLPEEKMALQSALQWFGFYQGGIDGAFGAGTRNSMAAWQSAFNLEPSGVLTSHQRATLIANYEAEAAEYGFDTLEEQAAGIRVTMPMAMVEFDRYEPPFVHFKEKNGSGLSIVLISQPGDEASFKGLYDLLQSLDALPATGERSLNGNRFTIHGTSPTHDSHADVTFEKGLIKGWMVLSTPEHQARNARLIEVLSQSFRPTGTTALDPGMVPLQEAARRGLVAGLEVKKPKSSHSGFYVTPEGAVLTSASAVASCGRITLDRRIEASVTLADEASGVALLTPERRLAPAAYGRFGLGTERLGAPVSVAGYSYGERLSAPVLTAGSLEEHAGLDGEPGLTRLSLDALAGDAGGPVLSESGAVIGMLLPQAPRGARQLPEGTAFAANGKALATLLAPRGINLAAATETQALPPESLMRLGTDMTVLVSCWE